MISNPLYGWCNFILGDFIGHPSYLTDVPLDLLDAFIDYYKEKKRSFIVEFDEEGTEFSLIVIDGFNIYIIAERETHEFYPIDNMSVEDMAHELIKDIETDIDGWSEFFTDVEYDKVDEYKEELTQKCNELKKYIDKEA